MINYVEYAIMAVIKRIWYAVSRLVLQFACVYVCVNVSFIENREKTELFILM